MMQYQPYLTYILLALTFASIGIVILLAATLSSKNSAAQKLSAETKYLFLRLFSGTEPFNLAKLLQSFCESTGIRCAVYGELSEGNTILVTRSIWLDGKIIDNYSLPISSSLAEHLITSPDRHLIPLSAALAKQDHILTMIKPIKNIAGTIYINPANGSTALFFCLHDAPLQPDYHITTLLKTVVALGSSELFRLTKKQINDVIGNEQVRVQTVDAVGKMAGWLAHDFNNIISAIGGYASLLKKKLPPDDRCINYIDRIMEAGKNASRLTGLIGSLVKNNSATSEPVMIDAILNDLTASMRIKYGSNPLLLYHAGNREAMILCDERHLRFCLTHIIENAVEACRDLQGEIHISTGKSSLKHDDLICQSFDIPGGDYLTLSIKDTGAGIPETILPQIFDPFFSTKKERIKDTGLGLTFVYRFVKNCHGAISVTSAVGKGTEIILHFPTTQSGTPAKTAPVNCIPAAMDSLNPKNILIVDDEASVREIYSELLADHGFTVYTSVDGQQALEFICKNSVPIDLILLDMIMPRLNGPDTFKLIREVHPSMRFIFISGLSNIKQLEQMLQEPGTLFLQKPCDDEKLLACISSMLSTVEVDAEPAS